MKDEFDRLVSEYFEGELDSAGERRLVELAESDASRMEMFRDMLRQDRLLDFEHKVGHPESFVESVMESIRSDSDSFASGVTEDIFTMKRRQKWLRVLALAASVMLVVGGLMWRLSGGDRLPDEGTFRVAEFTGNVRINGQIISDENSTHKQGSAIETGDRSSARLVLYDGSELRMDENTHMVSRDDRNVFLENGALLSRITPRRKEQENFVVAASENRSVTVLGTLFKTMLTDEIMDVVVREGIVRVRSGGFYEDVSAVSKIAINGKCLMPARSVHERRGEGRVATVDNAGVPYVALDAYIDSKMLFSDEFDDGLGFWKPYRFVSIGGKNLMPENVKEDELPDGIQIKGVRMGGKRTKALSLKFVSGTQHGVLLDYADLPRAYSVEYDISPAKNSSLESFISQRQWKQPINLLDKDKPVGRGKIRSGKKWYRCRSEYVEHFDEQGRRCVEGRLLVEGRPVFHVMHFVEGYYPGIMATRGSIKLDNVVVRKMELTRE